MKPEFQIAAWGAATIAPLLLNALTRQKADAIGIAAMLVMIWSIGRVLSALWTPPESMAIYPLIDTLAGMTVFYAWMAGDRAPWKLVLTGLYVGQCATAFSFWMAWPAEASLLRYLWVNNTLYALQLLTVASPGGVHVASRLLRWSMSARAGPFRHARLGPWP